jgi:PAS domain S-box-containing protein
MKLRTQLFLGYALVFAFMLFSTVLNYQIHRSLLETRSGVEHSHEVIARGYLLQKSLAGMRAEKQSFLLDGNEAHLQQYELQNTAYTNEMSRLKELVRYSRSQSERLEAVDLSINQWIRTVALPEIELRRQVFRGGMSLDTINRHLAENEVKRAVFGAINDTMNVFIAVERGLLNKRETAANAAARYANIAMTVATSLAIVLGISVMLIITRRVLRQVGGEPAEIASVTDRIARGNLETGIEGGTGILASVGAMLKALQENREQLLEGTARIRAIVETSVEGIITINSEGIIESFNAAAEKLFDYKAAEVIGKKVNILMPSPHRERHDDYIRHYLETGEAKIIGIGRDVDARRRDGSCFPIFLSISEMRLGTRRMFTGFISDMTDRKKAEEEILRLNLELEQRVKDRTRELKTANADLEAFAYSVSHDLRSPLRGVDGYSKLLLDDHRDKLDEDGQFMLTQVRKSAIEMGQLIDDLLTFSRLGRREMKFQPCDAGQIVRDLFHELQTAFPDRRLRLELADVPPCSGDPAMIREVVRNLLENAVKFTRTRAEAVIEVGTLAGPEEILQKQAASAGPRAGFVTYFVRDNGVGFDMQYKDKLFQVFQRLHRTEDFEGTGIGLALVRRIVVRHGGWVWAKSELDKGAAFFFSLPAQLKEEMNNA